MTESLDVQHRRVPPAQQPVKHRIEAVIGRGPRPVEQD